MNFREGVLKKKFRGSGFVKTKPKPCRKVDGKMGTEQEIEWKTFGQSKP